MHGGTRRRKMEAGMTWMKWRCPIQESDYKVEWYLIAPKQDKVSLKLWILPIINQISVTLSPGSIEHFEKLFYPKIPCKNCSTCWDTFTDEIKWFWINKWNKFCLPQGSCRGRWYFVRKEKFHSDTYSKDRAEAPVEEDNILLWKKSFIQILIQKTEQ